MKMGFIAKSILFTNTGTYSSAKLQQGINHLQRASFATLLVSIVSLQLEGGQEKFLFLDDQKTTYLLKK